MIGKVILHYEILAKLGAGGMGVVYKAGDHKLKRTVAIKFLPRQIAACEEERERFKIEARAAAALNHPNIATIYAIEEVEDELFIVMEYLDGKELRQIIGATGPLAPANVVHYATQIAEGLKAAHAKGIIHRDIKSGNIMVAASGQVKIMDFGLAKFAHATGLTKAGTTIGTVAYMSPEQARGEEVDLRTDIWSFGVVLYEMICGKLPFKGDIDQAVIFSILNVTPEPPSRAAAESLSVPKEMDRMVMKALTKDPAGRYQHVEEMLVELRALGSSVPFSRISSDRTPVGVFARRRPYLYAGFVVLIILLLAAGFFLMPRAPHTVQAIAVLPLKNLSQQAGQEYFSDGMTEQLITELSKTGGFRKVISRTSVMQYKEAQKSLPRIADELEVDAIVEGAVMHANGKVRIAIKLIEGRTERALWAETYEGSLADILALQNQVTKAIVNEIQLTLTPAAQKRLAGTRPVDPAAFDLYLKGRFHWNKRTAEGMAKSVEFFDQAIQKDSTYALAFAGLADAYNTLADWLILPPQEAFQKARIAATRALALDGTLAEARTSLAFVRFMFDWEWRAAEQEFLKAVELNAGYATAHQWYAEYLTAMGRFDEALVEIDRARELDPLSLIINAVRAVILFYAGEYQEAGEQCLKTLEIDEKFYQAHLYLAWIAEKKGEFQQAAKQYQKVVELAGETGAWSANPGTNHARAGNRNEAGAYLEELQKRAANRYVSPMGIAAIHAALGDREQAFAWLRQAYEQHETGLIYLNTFPLYDSLRANPRTQEILRDMGMVK